MGRLKLTQQEFVRRAAARHQDFYDYSEVVYRGANELVTISCPLHGPFTKRPGAHLFGSGCAPCGYLAAGAARKKLFTQNVAWFLEKAKVKHQHKYDYSLVDYAAGPAKIKIRCPAHGVFEQTARKHRAGVGCPACRLLNLRRASKARAVTTTDFRTRAQAVHGDQYDYSETVCEAVYYHVQIRCRVHGVFAQRAKSHLQGVGCPQCGRVLVAQARRRRAGA